MPEGIRVFSGPAPGRARPAASPTLQGTGGHPAKIPSGKVLQKDLESSTML